MQHGFMYVKGKQFRTVTIDGEVYIQASVLNGATESRRDPCAGTKFFQKVESLLTQGRPLREMSIYDFPEMNRGTYNSYIRNLLHLAEDKEGILNTKRTLKAVKEAGCYQLLSIILP